MIRPLSIALLFISLLLANGVYAADGTVQSIIGKAQLCTAKGHTWKPARLGTKIAIGDSIKTALESSLEIALTIGGVVRVAENTTICVGTTAKGDKSTGVQVSHGKVWANMKKIVGTGAQFEVGTPTAVAAIRGTVFRVNASQDSTTDVLVYQGKVAVGPGEALKNSDDYTFTGVGFCCRLCRGERPQLMYHLLSRYAAEGRSPQGEPAL